MAVTAPPETLVAQLTRLRDRVAFHKRAIKEHREQLQAAAAELAQVEAASRARGFGIHVVPAPRRDAASEA